MARGSMARQVSHEHHVTLTASSWSSSSFGDCITVPSRVCPVADRSARCQTKRQHGLLESLVMAPIPWQRIPCARVAYETRTPLQFRCSHLTVPCLVTARAGARCALKIKEFYGCCGAAWAGRAGRVSGLENRDFLWRYAASVPRGGRPRPRRDRLLRGARSCRGPSTTRAISRR
jgi:hypothetical protein